MGAADLRALGVELLSGKLGGGWAARAARVRALMETLIGPEGPPPGLAGTRTEPEQGSGLRVPVRARAPHRGGAEGAAMRFVDALVNRSFDELARLSHASLWTLWPEGSLACHARDDLLASLAARAGRSAKAIPEHPRSYTSSELRSVVPRGVAEAIDPLIELTNVVVVTMLLDSPQGSLGAISAYMSEDAQGAWRAHNLPLPAIDAAYRAGVPPSRDEDEAVRAADRIVRHYLYGHEKHVRSLRNLMMDRVLIGETFEPAEKLAELAREGPHRLERAELVFLDSARADVSALDARLGRARADQLRRGALKAWGRAFERSKLRVVTTKLAKLDDVTQAPVDGGEVLSIAVAMRDRPEDEERWRIGAVLS